MKKRLISVSLALVVLLAVTPQLPVRAAEKKTVYANTAQELSDAIASDTEIILSATTYVFDYKTIGKEYLRIAEVNNLSIKGVEGTKIVSTSEEDEVLVIRICKNIEISNVYIGHEIYGSGGCSSGVLQIWDSENITLTGCDIYGCGAEGLYVGKCSLKVINCTIRDCSRRIGSTYVADVEFRNCVFKNNGYGNEAGGKSWGFDTAAISIGYNEWEPGTASVVFNDCEFVNNNTTHFKYEDATGLTGEEGYNSGSTKVNNCVFSGNTWQQAGTGGASGSGAGSDDPLYGAADWALRELGLALQHGLILDYMIGHWGANCARSTAAEAILFLVEVSTGMSGDDICAQNGWDMNDAFADSDNRAVTFLKAAGISTGVDNVNFDPDGTFTRAQMVTMLGRAAENIFSIDMSDYPPGSSIFTDVPVWADPYVGWAAEVGITQGIGGGLFDSDGLLTIQHTGVFSYRAYNYVFSK